MKQNSVTSLPRLFSRDKDLLREADHRQTHGIPFFGVVYAHQLKVSIGACVNDLEIIAKEGNAAEFENRVYFLPM